MKKRKIWMLVICVFAMAMALSGVKIEAASAKTKALKAYKKFLSKKQIPWDANWKEPADKCSFTLAYIDKDNIPELVLEGGQVHAGGYGRIFTYKNGKVKRVGAFDLDGVTFDYYKKTGVFIAQYTGGGNTYTYSKLEKGKIVEKIAMRDELWGEKKYYACKGLPYEKISKSQFRKELKKLTGSKKKSSAKLHKNTAANRRKYCK